MVMHRRGFSLMEMMIVLLIMAIVTAATAPMLNKQSVDKASGVTPWVTADNDSIAFNLNNNINQNVIIGNVKIPRNAKLRPRLYIKTKDQPQIALAKNGEPSTFIWADESLIISSKLNDKNQLTIEKPKLHSVTIGQNSANALSSVAIGQGVVFAEKDAEGKDTEKMVAIGTQSEIKESESVTLGYKASVSGKQATLIGADTSLTSSNSTAIGYKANAGNNSTALGAFSQATSEYAVAIGASESTTGATFANGTNAIAIGKNALSEGSDSIALGNLSKASANTMAIGSNANAQIETDDNDNGIAIGAESSVAGNNNIAIATKLEDDGKTNKIAIGVNANAQGDYAIAIGSASADGQKAALAEGDKSIAIGHNVRAASGGGVIGVNAIASVNSTAIGQEAVAGGENSLAVGPGTTSANGGIAIGVTSDSIGSNSVLGLEAVAKTGEDGAISNSVSIGLQANSYANSAIAIGAGSEAGLNSISLGINSGKSATGNSYIAIGAGSQAGQGASAIGAYATATGVASLAIGNRAEASHKDSAVIGNSASTSADGQVMLGSTGVTVTVGGSLNPEVVKKAIENMETETLYLGGYSSDSVVTITKNLRVEGGAYFLGEVWLNGSQLVPDPTKTFIGNQYCVTYSDKRLKNVGEIFKGGLEEIKKLQVYNYTFKNDKEKTPRVGVMAQDLQKIFPNAVKEGEDGYLKIRFEDIFFAIVNAVRELDAKIDKLTAELHRIKDLGDEVASLKNLSFEAKNDVAELDKQFEELQKEIDELSS